MKIETPDILEELKHLTLSSPALFPYGRPILSLITKETSLRYVNGVVKTEGRELYTDYDPSLNRKEAEHKFVSSFGKEAFKKYFISSTISFAKSDIPLLSSEFQNGTFTVSEITSTSDNLISNLLTVATHNSIQTTLPLQLYSSQIDSLTTKPFAIQSMDAIAKLQEEQRASLIKRLKFTHLPIPPFTNILLSQVKKKSEIPTKLRQIRADYQQLRDQFVQLEKDVHESKNLKEQSDAYEKFKDFWRAFNRKYLNENSRIIYELLDLSEPSPKDKSGWLHDRKAIKRFKGMSNIWDMFGASQNIYEQLRQFERLFNVQFSNAELNGIHQLVREKFKNIKRN